MKKNWKKIFTECLRTSFLQGKEQNPVVDEDTAALEVLAHYLYASPERHSAVVVTPDFQKAESIARELSFWSSVTEEKVSVRLLPDGAWKTALSLDSETPRAEALADAVSKNPPDLFVGSILAVLSPVPDPAVFRESEIILRQNHDYPMGKLLRELVEIGYDDEPEAVTPGEFSKRGGIIDIYSPGMKLPCRIEFFGDTIDSIREYSPDNGRSIREVPFCRVLARSGCGCPAEGCDYPDFSAYASGRSLFLCFPQECADNLRKYGTDQHAAHWERFQQHLPDQYLFRTVSEAAEKGESLSENRICGIAPLLRAEAGANHETLEQLGRNLSVEFVKNLLSDHWKIILSSSGESDSEHIANWLSASGLRKEKNLTSAELAIPCGIRFPLSKTAFLTERELFAAFLRGKEKIRNPEDLEEDPVQASARELESMADIEVGDITVHLNYGICRFLGIRTITSGGGSVESLELEFDGESILHVPVWQAHLVTRYVGSHAKGPCQLSKLGSSRWSKARTEAAASARNLACDMLRLQALRRTAPGDPFPADGFEQKLFEDSFPFDETDGQQKAIDEIKRDMESKRPMDRLLCGDVGYGKTEVAMRAAFKAAVAGRQTAVLVPTTVLARQHYLSFSERFSEYPVVIETLSRLRTAKEKSDIIRRANEGSIDILIGTHAMLTGALKFRNLGLVIIDEEQRFGVEHKEKLKKLRSTVDVLTMTATPIPRTLHMSMSGLRDMSAITTAPVKRLPVRTIVAQNDPALVAAAISLELGRGGQIFYLHNRVNSIDKAAQRVKALAPEARIAIAHGQMKGNALDGIMGDFIEGKIDILVCTTIIESGIDIPNANTIIIDRADTFGLAELHQLRGRVGRWTRQAYAYLLLPPDGVMTTDARKRMSAIRRYTHLGSGFQLALRDLEIRGAGNIIGEEQSGHVDAIGFHLYCQLLKEISNTLRGVRNPQTVSCDLNLDFLEFSLTQAPEKLSACIPPAYIEDERLRLEAYRKAAYLSEIAETDAFQEELTDRFGRMPSEVRNFLDTIRLRIYGSKAGFQAVLCREGKVFLESKGSVFRRRGIIPKIDAENPPEQQFKELLQLLSEIAEEHKSL